MVLLYNRQGMLKHFFEMNDVDDGINSPKISKIIPHAKKTGSDRTPTIEEICIMLDSADIRTKCVILTCSSGIRVGVLEEMIWNDLIPIYKKQDDNENSPVAAKVIVYKGEKDEYPHLSPPNVIPYLNNTKYQGKQLVKNYF
ncbi:hypothetical protein [Nitrosopumilus sp.]|uniref:hypothetical protein n=1 Tax=Nitrosopumilus sp. TaxID=2024843 RepID=UPI00292FEB69|nr:hypothetical protein [Nitrosopumilus sp.]